MRYSLRCKNRKFEVLELLSEVDKWSQKYMLYRKGAVGFIALLMISVIVFFLNLSSVKISTTCLIFCFIAVIGIRWCLAKMDEFKSLYVNTVPMIDPEKDFTEEKIVQELEAEVDSEIETTSVIEVMESFVSEENSFEIKQNDVLEAEVVQDFECMKTNLLDELLEESSVQMNETPLDEDVFILPDLGIEELLGEEMVVNEIEIKDTTSIQEEMIEETTEQMRVEELTEVVEEQSSVSLEDQILEVVTHILKEMYDSIHPVTAKTVGNYFTIYSNKKVLMRLKLTGRKQYVLTHLNEAEVKLLGYEYEAPSKSEAYVSRVAFHDISVLNDLKQHIVELYQRCHKL